jgi:hypothetical protein
VSRGGLFGIACAMAVAAVAIYIGVTRWRGDRAAAALPRRAVPIEYISSAPPAPFVLFRDATPGELFGRVAIVRLPINSETRFVTPISCERVFYASGAGICLVSDEKKLPVRYSGFTFDSTFTPRHTFALTGPPIRARVSADGRRAAFTVFETGHSYADESFSTRTTILDTASSNSSRCARMASRSRPSTSTSGA